MIGKRFTLSQWLDQLAEDRELSAEAFRLAYLLATEKRGAKTTSSQPELAGMLGLKSPRSVKHLTDQLVDRGHVLVLVGNGRANKSRYLPVLHEKAV
jgi:hypothetical protein